MDTAPLPQDDRPSAGDVLVTTDAGLHFISIVPHPHRLSFKDLSDAIRIATQWANANGAQVWCSANGKTQKLHDKRSA